MLITVKDVLDLNGSYGWQNSNDIFKKTLGITMTEDMKEIENKININLIEYPRLNPFITTNMIEESVRWFYKYL